MLIIGIYLSAGASTADSTPDMGSIEDRGPSVKLDISKGGGFFAAGVE
jgi:hypothetical protein